MSFLAPLFLLGGLAVALPIVFHLIRRTSKEKMTFSSLMFLQPTPPRVTRRNRLENIFLLILRCLVLCLLALGFARPFLQKPMVPDPETGAGRKIIVLVDRSASMRREGMWPDAVAKAEEVLRKTVPADQVTSIVPGRTALHEYRERVAALGADAPASRVFETALWAQEQCLTRYVNPLLQWTILPGIRGVRLAILGATRQATLRFVCERWQPAVCVVHVVNRQT